MPEGIEPVEGEKVELPGGFTSPEDMYKALEKAKADLAEHKTRKSSLTALEQELETLRTEKQKRLDAERTDLEKAQARVAELESLLAEKDGAITKAQRSILLERELSKRLAGISGNVRGIAEKLYRSAAADFADEEELKALLDPVDEELKALQLPSGAKVTMTSGLSPDGNATPQGKQAAIDFLSMSYRDQKKALRRKK